MDNPRSIPMDLEGTVYLQSSLGGDLVAMDTTNFRKLHLISALKRTKPCPHIIMGRQLSSRPSFLPLVDMEN